MSRLAVDKIVGSNTESIVDFSSITSLKMPAGSVIQTLSTTKVDDHFQSATTSFVDVTGVTLTITPKYNTSKILVTVSGAFSHNTSSRMSLFNIVRDSTNIGQPTSAKAQSSTRTMYHNGTDQLHQLHIEFLDSPATTSTTTYKLQMRTNDSGTLFIGDRVSEDARQGTTMTLMEISQ
jgi:hypothetical protein